MVRDVFASLNQMPSLLFSFIVPKRHIKSKEFCNRFKLRSKKKSESGSFVQRQLFDSNKLEMEECSGEAILFEGNGISEVLEIQNELILVKQN